MSKIRWYLFLSDENFLRRNFDTHVTAGDHDGVGLSDDIVDVVHPLKPKKRIENVRVLLTNRYFLTFKQDIDVNLLILNL